MLVQLLYKQALCLHKLECYEYSTKLAKICGDLCPDGFEAWILLAEGLIQLKKIREALVVLDIVPYYDI